ncbi:MAG: hypothetical protein AAB585_01635 [Patescibacteria group bacterium]
MDYRLKMVTADRWRKLSLFAQLGNIGGEVSRALKARAEQPPAGQPVADRLAADRALALLDLTIADPKNQRGGRGKELWRVREVLADFFYGDNEYKSTEYSWRKYFDAFAYAANLQHSL